MLRGAPAAARYLFDPRARKNAARGKGYPRRLGALELLGVVAGPVAYVRSVRRARVATAGHAAAEEPGGGVAVAAIELERGLAEIELGAGTGGVGDGGPPAQGSISRDPLGMVAGELNVGRGSAQSRATPARSAAS